MASADPAQTADILLKALRRSGHRAIVASGGGGIEQAALPGTVFAVDFVPHQWLFPRVRAAVHHGGAGTTAAALRAGVPSIIVPFFADQFFWGARLHSLGLTPRPIPKKRLTTEALELAFDAVTGSTGIPARCQVMSGMLRSEDGVQAAGDAAQRYLLSVSRATIQ